MFPRVVAPDSGIQHLERSCKININSVDRGNGTLYISEERLIWENEEHRGLSLGYRDIAIHAVSKDLQNFPEECLYVMYNRELVEENPSQATMNGNNSQENEESDEDGDYPADNDGKISEIRFIPESKDNLQQMFEAMSACQCLHPDSEDDDDYYEGGDGDFGSDNYLQGAEYNPTMVYEDGGGEGFYTSEEGLQHLTPQGQATLERLENMLAQSQISQPLIHDAVAQMGGVNIEDDEDNRPNPNEPPVVGRPQDDDDKMDESAHPNAVEGQFDDAV